MPDSREFNYKTKYPPPGCIDTSFPEPFKTITSRVVLTQSNWNVVTVSQGGSLGSLDTI